MYCLDMIYTSIHLNKTYHPLREPAGAPRRERGAAGAKHCPRRVAVAGEAAARAARLALPAGLEDRGRLGTGTNGVSTKWGHCKFHVF